MEFNNSGKDTNLHYLMYRSTAKENISTDEIDYILANAKVLNMRENITGVLLFDGHEFLQFLEGSKNNLGETYNRIQKSSQHHSINQIAYNPSDKRYFNNWSMGFCEAPKSVLQEVAEANWQSVIDASKAVAGQFHGLTLLLDFCRDADGR